MIVSLQQAKQMDCPQMFTADTVSNCRGQVCMAWRWLATKKNDGTPIPLESREGFCGLAYSVRLPPP